MLHWCGIDLHFRNLPAPASNLQHPVRRRLQRSHAATANLLRCIRADLRASVFRRDIGKLRKLHFSRKRNGLHRKRAGQLLRRTGLQFRNLPGAAACLRNKRADLRWR